MNSQNIPNCPRLSEATICQIILDDSDAKFPKRSKVKEINLKPDKPEPTKEVPEPYKTKQKTNFQAMGIASNLSKTLLQKHPAVKYVSTFKDKFIADNLAKPAKRESKQEISKKAPQFGPFRGK